MGKRTRIMTDPPDSNRAATFLLVEDNPDHADLVQRSIRRNAANPPVIHLPDGEQAMSSLHHRPRFEDAQRPDAIILDLKLPGLDGRDLLTMIKGNSALQDIPVIVLTTSRSREDLEFTYRHGANSYLIKHLDYEKF